jgi:hypothetical protein
MKQGYKRRPRRWRQRPFDDLPPRDEEDLECCVADESQAERFGYWLAEVFLENVRQVRRYIEPTVQLLIKEDYSAASCLGFGYHLVAFCPDHFLIGLVGNGAWPSGVLLDLFETAPVPPGTKRVVFRWHNLRGIPDRKEI